MQETHSRDVGLLWHPWRSHLQPVYAITGRVSAENLTFSKTLERSLNTRSGPGYHILFLLQRGQLHLSAVASDFHPRNPVSEDVAGCELLSLRHQLSSSAHQDENACVRTPGAQLCTLLSNSNKCNFQAFPESGVFPSWHFLPSRLRNESSRSLPYSGRGCRKSPDFVCVYLLGELGKKIPQADFWIRRFTCERSALKVLCVGVCYFLRC